MRVEFTIDELVMLGFEARAGRRVAETIERDLVGALTPAAVRGLVGAADQSAGGTRVGARAVMAPAGVASDAHGIAASIVAATDDAHARRGEP